MAEFSFTARNAAGQTQKGTLTAHDRTAAMSALRNRGLQPVVVKDAKKSGGMNINIPLPGGNKVKSKDLVVFTRQFSTMVDAGVPIMRSLAILKDQAESAVFKKVLEQVTADVQGGTNLSDAMAKHPNAFSQIYVNMVRAGEALSLIHI